MCQCYRNCIDIAQLRIITDTIYSPELIRSPQRWLLIAPQPGRKWTSGEVPTNTALISSLSTKVLFHHSRPDHFYYFRFKIKSNQLKLQPVGGHRHGNTVETKCKQACFISEKSLFWLERNACLRLINYLTYFSCWQLWEKLAFLSLRLASQGGNSRRSPSRGEGTGFFHVVTTGIYFGKT